jgi:hypothetical protein
MAYTGQDMQSCRRTPTDDLSGDLEKPRIRCADDPAQLSRIGRQRPPEARHSRESVLVQRRRETARALAQTPSALPFEGRGRQLGLRREQGLRLPSRDERRHAVLEQPTAPTPVDSDPLRALRGIFETRMGGDDGSPAKAFRVERHQTEGEPSAQRVSDDGVDRVGQRLEDGVETVLEGSHRRRVCAMSGQVDGQRRSLQARTAAPPILAAAGKPVQQQDQSVASAMRASRSLSRSIRA